jgi:hypothetical protein
MGREFLPIGCLCLRGGLWRQFFSEALKTQSSNSIEVCTFPGGNFFIVGQMWLVEEGVCMGEGFWVVLLGLGWSLSSATYQCCDLRGTLLLSLWFFVRHACFNFCSPSQVSSCITCNRGLKTYFSHELTKKSSWMIATPLFHRNGRSKCTVGEKLLV